MIRKKKGIKALALGLIITILSCSFAFADTATIPMSLAIKAKEIDVTVTEKVIMSASAGKSVMDVGDITVTNNAAGNGVYLIGAAYGGNVSPWSLVADSTNFKTMKKDQHKYSLTADGTDLSASSKEYSEFIDIGGSYTIAMAGKTGLSTSAVSDQQTGSVILTVGLTDPNAVEIVSWADGTDAQIVAMVAALDAGKITVEETGWKVGDTRTVHLSAMEATGVGETHAEQDVELVLMHAGGYELADGSACNFVVGQKDALAEKGYMNSTNTSSGSWDGSARRAWCNDVYKNAIPSTLQPIFKQFKTITAETYNGTTLKTSLDYFALPAEREVFGAGYGYAGNGYANNTEAACENIFQFDWYKTSANRIKKMGISGNDAPWWERSPDCINSGYFCGVGGGSAASDAANYTYGLAPFGCI